MEKIHEWSLAMAIAIVGFFSRWWFIKTEKKIEEMDRRVYQNERAIELNTQSDKDYRENTSQILKEIKATQNEIYKLLINK